MAGVVAQVHEVVDHADDVLAGQDALGLGGAQVELLVHLVAAHAAEVVALGIEEAREQHRLTTLDGGHVAGTQLAVNLDEGVFHRRGLVGLEGLLQVLGVPEQLQHLVVLEAHGPEQHGSEQLTGLVDADVDQVVGVGLELQPGAAVGDDGGGKSLLARRVELALVVNAGRTNDLGHDDAIGAIDDEGAVVRHHGQVAHEDFLLLDLAGLLVDQADGDAQGTRVGGVTGAALVDAVLRRAQRVVGQEVQLEAVGVVGDRREGEQLLFQTLFQEPLEGVALDLDQIRQVLRQRVHVSVGIVPEFVRLRHSHHPLVFGDSQVRWKADILPAFKTGYWRRLQAPRWIPQGTHLTKYSI
ncbi:hypothetical protein D3C72_742210 [compost metagenome]